MRQLAAMAVVAVGVFGTAGCSAAASAAGPGASCGSSKTAAGVTVRVEVGKGRVDCATALRVEADYAAAIRDGRLQGNGGGAPVRVDGWTCTSYSAADALRTGRASQCHTANAEVVAVLSPASSAASAVTGS